jgi:mRNA interferase MazF
MQSGTTPRQREVWLAPAPFTDQDASKLRPVLVISTSISNARWADGLVMAITSKTDSPLPGLVLTVTDFEHGALPVESKLIALRVFSIRHDRLVRCFGRLRQSTFAKAIALLQEHIY